MPNLVELTPTNIITGFLGVGKTTAILHLLQHKPANERWAVLVNEFGEVGIDGALLAGDGSAGLFIKEVPGGCMCCAAGLPMQVALNVLLKQAKPHRLLIEPTGLGHPKEVLQVLGADHYQGVLDIQNTVTLVDARKIADPRYTNHPIFAQQLEVADVIVANKSEQYQAGDFNNLTRYLREQGWDNKQLLSVTMGKLSPSYLQGQASHAVEPVGELSAMPAVDLSAMTQETFPACGYLSYERKQADFDTKGWRFSQEIVFDQQAIYQLIASTPMQRIKGVFITSNGVHGYNMTEDALSEIPLSEAVDSRIEIIAVAGNSSDDFETALLALAGCG